MTRIAQAFQDVRAAERELADQMRTVGERHAADVDVFHVAHLLASRCDQQLELLRQHAERSEDAAPTESTSLLERRRWSQSEPLGRHEASGLVLLSDLRDLYVLAHRAELAWVVVLQVGRATRDADLIAAASKGQEEAERRWKWLRTKIKESCPQALVAG